MQDGPIWALIALLLTVGVSVTVSELWRNRHRIMRALRREPLHISELETEQPRANYRSIERASDIMRK